jgi:hypothetical protein
MMEYLQKVRIKSASANNIIHYNNGYGVESYAASNSKVR